MKNLMMVASPSFNTGEVCHMWECKEIARRLGHGKESVPGEVAGGEVISLFLWRHGFHYR